MKIHTTIGLYLNGTFKVNGVRTEDLENHIQYNKCNRFGRALFVDGKCVHNGYLSVETIKEFSKKIKKQNIKLEKETIPYQ